MVRLRLNVSEKDSDAVVQVISASEKTPRIHAGDESAAKKILP